jgi:hypothetical protein
LQWNHIFNNTSIDNSVAGQTYKDPGNNESPDSKTKKDVSERNKKDSKNCRQEGSFIISDVKEYRSCDDSVTITWVTPDANTVATMVYGLSKKYELGSYEDGVFSQSHAFTLEQINPNEIYYYRITATDYKDCQVSLENSLKIKDLEKRALLLNSVSRSVYSDIYSDENIVLSAGADSYEPNDTLATARPINFIVLHILIA